MNARAAEPRSARHLVAGVVGALMLVGAVALAVSVTAPTEAAENQEPGGAGTWGETEPLTAGGRAEHSATRLDDGRVLTAGGRVLNEDPWGDDDELSLQSTAEVYDPAEGAWRQTACFGNARADHTATTLADGRVLVTSGSCGREAHLYDPDTGAWEPAGTMSEYRIHHTATRLADGRVLVAGGEKNGTAEIYDPDTNSWSDTGQPLAARVHHTATRLADGRVLVAGGRNPASNSSQASAEVFDPKTEEWESAAPMATQRHRHTATLLTDEGEGCGANCGKVLVAGGMFQQSPGIDESYQSIATVELYDPKTGTWSQASPMGTRRSEHTATRLADGRVLVAAGHTVAAGVLGGLSNVPEPERHDSAEIFDPLTGQWEQTDENLTEARATHTATRLGDGTVLVAGGGQGLSAGNVTPHLDSVEIYDPEAASWSASDGALVEATAHHAAASLHDGGALITGGISEHSQPLASPQRYDVDDDTWEVVGAAATPRGRHSATRLADGRVLVAGGLGIDDTPQASAEVYDPEGIWEPAGSMDAPRSRHSATRLVDGRVLVAGGSDDDGTALDSVEIYSPDDGWQSAGSLATARTHHTATRLGDGRVLVAGGTGGNGEALASVEVFEPGDGWSSVASLGDARAGHTATMLDDGRILVAGGAGSDGTALASAEVYHPGRDEWEPVASMSTARTEHTATAHPDGQVVVAGGLDGDQARKAAEVFAPDLDAWRQTGPMLASRGRHTVTLLTGDGCGEHCGKMLAAGGLYTRGSDSLWLDAAELYDPGGTPSGAWALTGSMATEREEHTAVLLDGPACRDTDPPDHCGKVLVAGGEMAEFEQRGSASRHALASAELYDPATGEWTETGSLDEAHRAHTATLLDGPPCHDHDGDPPEYCGKVLVAGGDDDDGSRFPRTSPIDSAELYDPVDGEWTSTGSLNTARQGHTATALPDGSVLVMGGLGEGGSWLASVERYNPVTEQWEAVSDLLSDRHRMHTATLLPDREEVLVTGGRTANTRPAERYALSSGPSRPTTYTNETRYEHTAHRLVDGRVLVVGHHRSESGEIYDPATELWQPTEPALRTKGHVAVRLDDGRVLVAGGNTENAAQLFDPEAASDQAWSVTGFMNHDRDRGIRKTGPTATQLPTGPKAACGANCGKVLVAGGSQGSGVVLASAEVYAPQPQVTDIEPVEGLATGGGEVVLEGTGLASVREVWFGDQRVGRGSVQPDEQRPDEKLVVTAPSVGEATSVRVRVVTDGGVADAPDEFAYVGPPGKVEDLTGRALSAGRVELSWSAVGATGSAEPPAQRYDIRRATTPIEGAADFADATQVCDCDYRPGQVGTQLVFEDGTVAADTSYFYAVRAADADGREGPVSNVAEIATPAEDDAGGDGGNGNGDDSDGAGGGDDGGNGDDGDGAGGGDGDGAGGGDGDGGGGDGDGGVGPGEVGPPGVIRLAGADRFATAAAASRDAFADGAAGAAVLARADGFADALAGGPLAVARDGPLLVTVSDGLHPTTRDELERVLPAGATVYLLGGEQALSPTVAQEVEALGYQVRRLAGSTRVETALAVAGELGDPDRLLVATGFDFPDALAAGAAAAHVDGAVLLTRSDAPSQATADYLAGRDGATVHAVGGTAVNPYAGQADHTLAGAERTATATEVAEFFFDAPAAAGVARSDDFPDALTGGTHIGQLGGPMLLTPVDRLAGSTGAYLCAVTVETAYVYGGTAAVSEATSDAVAARLGGTGC